MTVRGLEGSTDLPIGKESSIGHVQNKTLKRIKIHAKEYNYSGREISFTSLENWKEQAIQTLEAVGPLTNSVIWNSGVYLWASKRTNTIEEGLIQSKALLQSGAVKNTLEKLINWRQEL